MAIDSDMYSKRIHFRVVTAAAASGPAVATAEGHRLPSRSHPPRVGGIRKQTLDLPDSGKSRPGYFGPVKKTQSAALAQTEVLPHGMSSQIPTLRKNSTGRDVGTLVALVEFRCCNVGPAFHPWSQNRPTEESMDGLRPGAC